MFDSHKHNSSDSISLHIHQIWGLSLHWTRRNRSNALSTLMSAFERKPATHFSLCEGIVYVSSDLWCEEWCRIFLEGKTVTLGPNVEYLLPGIRQLRNWTEGNSIIVQKQSCVIRMLSNRGSKWG